MASPDKIDNFKFEFKYFKQKTSVPSFDSILDFENSSSIKAKTTKIEIQNKNSDNLPCNVQSPDKWSAFLINSVPGLYFVKSVFSETDQIYWCKKCVQEYTRSPYVTNLDAFQSKDTVNAAWQESQESFDSFQEQKDLSFLKKTPIWNMRWSTLGYHHNWDSKKYQKDTKSNFPLDIGSVSKCIAESLGFMSYVPEAAIVNYYHVGSTLAPHTDVSEADLSLPLLSISFGLDAIFLIGGDTRDIKPTAILLRSADVVIMSGKSRTAYHALPRVLPTSKIRTATDDANFLSLYLQHSRININIRQVESENCTL